MKQVKRWLVSSLIFQLLYSTSNVPALANEGETGGTPTTPQTPPDPGHLDLTSTVGSISSDHLFDGGHVPVAINVGGQTRDILAGALLTPGEFIAAAQVLLGGQQNIQLGAAGNAVGGSFLLNDHSLSITNLVIPTGVSAIHDFGTAATLNLAGNLSNAGSLFAISTNAAVSSATISAGNIFNQTGGLLTSVIPAGGLAGYGFANLVSNLNLSLFASNNIINSGIISSAGNLSVVAGNTIINSATLAGITPIMQAANNLNLQAMNIVNQGVLASQTANVNALTANLTNSGSIQALMGNVAIASLGGNDLSIAGAGSITARDRLSVTTTETIKSLTGDIVDKANIKVDGGSLSAATIAFTSPEGLVDIDALSISGDTEVDEIGRAHV